MHYGYAAHRVASGAEALRLCRAFAGAIDVVVTDVVMPEMNGREVARQVTELKPNARILFVSGGSVQVPGGVTWDIALPPAIPGFARSRIASA